LGGNITSFLYKNKNVSKSIQFWNSEVSMNQVVNEIQTKKTAKNESQLKTTEYKN